MAKIPKIIRWTKTVRRIREYMEREFTEVRHTTLNPEGPGVIRIHLIPPKTDEENFYPSVAIINGSDIIPVNFLWAIMLAELIKNVNAFDGREMSEEDLETVFAKTAEQVKKIVPMAGKKKIATDIHTVFTTMK